jgi:hypothetical protein
MQLWLGQNGGSQFLGVFLVVLIPPEGMNSAVNNLHGTTQ